MTDNNTPTISDSSKQISIIDKYFSSSILTSEDSKNLSNSLEFMISSFMDVPMYRPLVIKLFGVLGNKDFPTVDSRVHQCKVEAEVHSNELIRDMLELQVQKNSIEKSEYLLQNIMLVKYSNETDEISKKEIEFDIKDQTLIISRKKFEYSQLEKKIKYRISEVHEWRLISEKLTKSPDFKNQKYDDMMTELLQNSYTNKLLDNSEKTEAEKAFLTAQLDTLKSFQNKKIN